MPAFERLARNLERNRITRRDALWLIGASCIPAGLSGCTTSPVTGESILVGMSEEDERKVDARVSPHQFSRDLGAVQDPAINRYVTEVGDRLDDNTHRPTMPYSYRVLNANYVNAYTFPGGAMGVTRGILVELNDEAELAGLLGHELGHVNARHVAQQQGRSMMAQAAVAGLNVAARDSSWGTLISMGGQLGASALLSGYSRDDERQADALGQEYMVRGGYPATGMTRLQQLLVDQEKQSPGLVQTMFATHPMSVERRDTARRMAETRYADSNGRDARRERFMDSTASLRRIKPTIDDLKQGETAMAKKEYPGAEAKFESAIKRTPQDYAANVRMAQCLQATGRGRQALDYADSARKLYPQEAQAHKMAGVLSLELRDPAQAMQRLDEYDRILPGDPGILFLKGVSQEGLGNRRAAAQHYNAFLRQSQQGDAAQYAYSRLRGWGYMR